MAKTMRLALAAVGLGAFGWLAQSSMYNVDGGHRAIIFDKLAGVKRKVYDEGTHFLVPILQNPIVYDVRTRPSTITTVTGTKDLQSVSISLRVLSKPSIEHLPDIFSRLGIDYDERVLPSIGNEVLKAIVAQFNADQLLTMRDTVSHKIRESLTKRAEDFHILLDDVSITHLAFSKEFAQAIEAKQVAQQEAERSKFVVMKSEQEKLAAIILAEGESQAADNISKALGESGSGLIEIRRLEAAKDIADTLARARNVSYIPGASGNFLLNLGNQ